jgi:hypothetical protein
LPPANCEKRRPENRTYGGPEAQKIDFQRIGDSCADECTSDSEQKIGDLEPGLGEAPHFMTDAAPGSSGQVHFVALIQSRQ